MSEFNRTIWLFGLSGAGKTCIANALRWLMIQYGRMPILLDGDTMRRGMCSDLGFSETDRRENVRRVAHMANHLQMSAVGVVPIVSLITPIDDHREFVRRCIKDVFMVHVATPLEVCEQRDRKGLYSLARRGEIKNFTGVHATFENPRNADFTVSTQNQPPEQCARSILSAWSHC
jgi:adenylyl-sulfate kinase